LKNVCVIGIGELTLDEMYIEEAGKLKLVKKDAGGTVWNMLCNLSMEGIKTIAVGACGDDEDGKRCVQSLEEFNVSTKYVKRQLKNTRKVHIMIKKDSVDESELTANSYKSPVSEEEVKQNTNNKWIRNIQIENIHEYEQCIVVINCLRKEYFDYAFELKKKNNKIKIALDIGYRGFVRYISKQKIIEFLKNIDILQTNEKVYRFMEISKKLTYEDIMNETNIEIMSITKGSKGVDFIYKENENIKVHKCEITSPAKVIDPSGAGDAFFATLLNAYMKETKITSKFLDKTFENAIEVTKNVVGIIGAREHLRRKR